MLNIVTVQVGNYCGRGAEYVDRLFDGIGRNLTGMDYKGFCLTDDPASLPPNVEPLEPEPGISGWWNKISLFKPGILPRGERVLFSDLDAIVTGDIADIASYAGKFAAIRDFYNHVRVQSALMAWEAGTVDHIWLGWEQSGKPQFDPRGDQAFIECMQPDADYWQDMLPGQVMSFKDCRRLGGVPSNVRVVCFHGRPRLHEINFNLKEI